MPEQIYIEITKQMDEIREIQKLEDEAAKDEVGKWLDLKDECQRRYEKLGRWVVDTMDDLPF